MFYIVFVFFFFFFFCILQVLVENTSNSWIITANSLLERFNSKSILNLRKKKSAKSVIFLKNPEWARLCILIVIFSSNIGLWWNWWRWKAKNKCKKYVRNKFFLIRTFTIPKRPDNKESQICTNLESFSYLDWNFKKMKRFVLILFGLGDQFMIFLGFLGFLVLL